MSKSKLMMAAFALVLGAACIPVAVTASVATSAAPHLLRYRVTHSIFGEIGTYANKIDRDGDAILVETEVHLLVSAFGIVLHREDAERSERWVGDRLVAFHSVTTANGEAKEIRGEAREDGFAITSPEGTVVAPAGIRPSNPWSARFLGADEMLRVDTGAIEHVQISAAKSAALTIDAKTVRVREYEIAADPPYTVWLDDHDVPVKFTVDDVSGLVSFTLAERS